MDVPRIPGYEVLGRIGVGSSAQVWRARRLADDLDVALKVVQTEPEQVSGALREAGVLARVRHEHLIHLYDVLPVPGVGGRPRGVALAMELADGGSLAEVLGARDHLTPGELVTVCSPLAGALAQLHQAGVVHGDIAPGNVLFRADGMPLLADLGFSRIAGDARPEAWGTDGMVAPEVLEGFAPSAESDVYGMGALAWRALVGEAPGWVGTRSELGELRPELPPQLVALVTSCLAAEPSDRPEAEELEVALFACARPEPVELAPGADPAAGLTQRIRAEAGESDGASAADPAPSARLGGRSAARSAARSGSRSDADSEGRPGAIVVTVGRRRLTHPRALHRADEPRRTRRWPNGRVGWWVGGAAATVVLLALLVVPWVGSLLGMGNSTDAQGTAVAGPVAVDPPASAGPDEVADPAGTADPVGTVDPTSSTDSISSTDPAERTDPAEPSASDHPQVLDPVTAPEASVQQLLDGRAAAWLSGDPADLAAAHAAGSPALEQEQQSLETAREREVSYRGLSFTVARAAVLEQEEDRVVLQVGVERSSYEEVSQEAGAVPHPGRTDVVELELRREEGDWRIWGWG